MLYLLCINSLKNNTLKTMAKQITTQIKLSHIINDYNSRGFFHQQLELNYYSLNNVEDIVSGYKIYIKLPNGKLQRLWCNNKNHANLNPNNLYIFWPNEHQWWMQNNNSLRTKIANIIRNKVLTKSFSNFDDLYDELFKLNITSGDLLRYDITKRLAHCLNLPPSKYVYLHAGAKKGAHVLHQKGLINLPSNYSRRVNLNVFSGLFPNMDSIDIENLLCIYKKDF